ncbi:MAG TPA: cytochrome C oxidase subunit IV family protein [Candidatus Thalassarchaeaceae archaeon]|nr:cytochrome C oxidase subunit IV family protein [Candidatus Thalassarchaeaceae archaeon]HJM18932.1 cytochrome C oxidase subunit IV family protein [Candidatus Thalassarchaeaceae archaeon]HJM87557.1 cytochrome C oxidase subunit IV family protein [Candidatus Thalassarchaeaceae archaeon]
MSHKILGKDAYNMNFAMLMILTAIEVGAVAASVKGTIGPEMVILVLVSIGAVKFLGIAFVFMHLRMEPDSNILTLTALFPAFFIIIMIVFIAITTPGAPDSLPAWCRF